MPFYSEKETLNVEMFCSLEAPDNNTQMINHKLKCATVMLFLSFLFDNFKREKPSHITTGFYSQQPVSPIHRFLFEQNPEKGTVVMCVEVFFSPTSFVVWIYQLNPVKYSDNCRAKNYIFKPSPKG